jgi:hypothetical protein
MLQCLVRLSSTDGDGNSGGDVDVFGSGTSRIVIGAIIIFIGSNIVGFLIVVGSSIVFLLAVALFFCATVILSWWHHHCFTALSFLCHSIIFVSFCGIISNTVINCASGTVVDGSGGDDCNSTENNKIMQQQ